jgi:hypothetical protein
VEANGYKLENVRGDKRVQIFGRENKRCKIKWEKKAKNTKLDKCMVDL